MNSRDLPQYFSAVTPWGQQASHYNYICGFCYFPVANAKCIPFTTSNSMKVGIYECGRCHCPTIIVDAVANGFFPIGLNFGVINLKDKPDFSAMFYEAYACFGVGAWTGCMLICQRLLIAISLDKGAEKGKLFNDYIDYLVSAHIFPSEQQGDIDSIKGANIDDPSFTQDIAKSTATRLLILSQAMLSFLYQVPEELA